MQTELFEVDPLSDNRKLYARAAEALGAGALVGIPTETVYGLGADALNPEAVARIFEAKGRPSFDPLIIHVHHGCEVEKYTAVAGGGESAGASYSCAQRQSLRPYQPYFRLCRAKGIGGQY